MKSRVITVMNKQFQIKSSQYSAILQAYSRGELWRINHCVNEESPDMIPLVLIDLNATLKESNS